MTVPILRVMIMLVSVCPLRTVTEVFVRVVRRIVHAWCLPPVTENLQGHQKSQILRIDGSIDHCFKSPLRKAQISAFQVRLGIQYHLNHLTLFVLLKIRKKLSNSVNTRMYG